MREQEKMVSYDRLAVLALRLALTLTLTLAIGGCSQGSSFLGSANRSIFGAGQSDALAVDAGPGLITNFAGVVVADEPRAAVVGRNILSAGGNAADAAIAAYFAMSVTLPGSAGIGGGGNCLIHDATDGRDDALVFVPFNYLAQLTQGAGRFPGRDIAMVPGNPRGMAALHARYGQKRWGQLLAPAIEMARDGHTVSRALADQLATAPVDLRNNPDFARVFGRGGFLLGEGDVLLQPELANFLARLTSQDPILLYDGEFAREFVAAANSTGVLMTVADMDAYAPEFLTPVSLEFGSHVLQFAPPPGDGSALIALQMAFLADDDRYVRSDVPTKTHLFAEAQILAMAGLQDWVRNFTAIASQNDLIGPAILRAMEGRYDPQRHIPPGPNLTRTALDLVHDSAGLVTVDRFGSSVACSFSMNAPFGIGKMVPGTGVILGAPMADPGALASPTGVAMMVNKVNNLVFYAAASGGGLGGVSALAQVTAFLLHDQMSLADAIAAPRVLAAYGRDDILLYENRLAASLVDGLGRRGHRLVASERIGSVSAVYCPEGLPRVPVCVAQADPRVNGIVAPVASR